MTKFTYKSKIHSNQKYQLLVNGREKVGIKKYKKSINEYSETIDDVHENLEDYNPTNC